MTERCDKCKKPMFTTYGIGIRWGNRDGRICANCVGSFVEWLKEPVNDGYCLTFSEAIVLMVEDHEICECKCNHSEYRFNPVPCQFEMCLKTSDVWESCVFQINAQDSNWRVVE